MPDAMGQETRYRIQFRHLALLYLDHPELLLGERDDLVPWQEADGAQWNMCSARDMELARNVSTLKEAVDFWNMTGSLFSSFCNRQCRVVSDDGNVIIRGNYRAEWPFTLDQPPEKL